MFKKICCLVLIGLLTNVVGLTSVYAGSQDDKQAAVIDKVRENVRKLGTGKEARLEVKLTDGTKHKGYIVEARAEDFVVLDSKTAANTTISYRDVSEIKGSNRLTAAKVGVTVVKGVAVVAAVAAAATLFGFLLLKTVDNER